MKEAYYFSHDSNARNDQRLMKVRMKYGMEGYGIYFGIIEILREQKDYILTFNDIDSISFDLRVDKEKIEDVIQNYDLFKIEGHTMFYSKSLKRRLECMDEKKKKRQEAGRLGGIASAKSKQQSTNATTNAKALNKTTLHNTKRKYIKDIKSLKSINTEYLEQLQEKHPDIDVNFQFQKFRNYLEAKGKTYKNYRAAFNNWIISDYCKPSTNGVKKKLNFKITDGKNYLGYCSKCLKSDFYEPYNFNPEIIESRCCNTAILNERPTKSA